MTVRKNRAKTKPPVVPRFASEDAERAFWATADSTTYLDWHQARAMRLPALKPSTETISLRLPADLLEELKVQANRRDVPYQSLLKVYLAERVASERRHGRARRADA